MKNFMKKLIFFMAIAFSASTSLMHAMPQSMSKDEIWVERREANAFDATFDTIAAKVINDYILQNPTNLSLGASLAYGVGSWLTGELAETIYKKAYKIFTGKNLRATLGKTTIFGIEIDHQRLMRRVITVAGLCAALYLRGQQ